MTGRMIRGAIGIGLACTAVATGARPVESGIRAVETGLRPAVIVEGEPVRTMAIAARMAEHRVPGISVAVIENHRIVWARGYGVRGDGAGPVDATTLFQAASMSKPVAAAVSLTLAHEGRIGLDAPVNDALKSWQLPSSAVAPASAVTLRRLLSHSAGLTVHGFGGYAAGAPVPTVPQLLDGQAPANSGPVRIDLLPGTKMRYSGGGSTIGQLMVEDVAGEPFAAVARQRILSPLRMVASGYDQPLPAARAALAATGHGADGRAIAGRWHTYPELAAAGLWTTPSDLARFLIAVSRASKGASDSAIAPAVAKQLTTAEPGLDTGRGGMALGFFVEGQGRNFRFGHSGGNEGFRGNMVFFPETGQGAVVMTNGDGGSRLTAEVLRSIAAAYDWPDTRQRSVRVVPQPAEVLAGLEGGYVVAEADNAIAQVIQRDGALEIRMPGQPPMTVRPEGGDRFFEEGQGLSISFTRGADGKGQALSVDGRPMAQRQVAGAPQ